MQGDFAEERGAVRALDHADCKTFSGGEMQGDVAAVVNVGAGEPGCRRHSVQDFFRHGAGNRGHWSDESSFAVGRNRGLHASRDDAHCRRYAGVRGLSQSCEFATEFIENMDEAVRGCAVGNVYLIRLSECFDDQVDRPVVKMKTAAVGQ